MGCSCSENSAEYTQRVNELLASAGLKEVVEQGREAIAEAGRAVDRLNSAARATALGFASDVASLHRDAAIRSNQRAQEQAETVLLRLDNVLQGGEWRTQVERARVAFKEHGGAKKLEALRADVRLHLLEAQPGLSASVAELSLATLDGAIKAASGGDLNQVAAHMRRVMDEARRGFAAPEMGRQPIGPGLFGAPDGDTGPAPIGGGADTGWCVALAACLAWAWSSLIASMILCFAIPFCWCCLHLAFLGTFALHQLACILLLEPKCRRG